MKQENYEIPSDMAKSIVDPEAFLDPHRIDKIFSWLRQNNPVGLAQVPGFRPFWVITKNADVSEVSRRADLFSTTILPPILGETVAQERMMEINNGSVLFPNLVTMDDPGHRLQRDLFAPYFTAIGVKGLEGRVREIAQEYVQKMIAMGGKCDFATDISQNFPLRVVMSLLGVPAEDEQIMSDASDLMFNSQDEDVNESGQGKSEKELAEQFRAKLESTEVYYAAILEDRRANPRDDISTILANAKINDVPLSTHDAVGHCLSLATAGHHTTAATLAGAISLLCEYPEYFKKLQSDPSAIRGFVEEALRWISPAKHFMRTAAVDTELRDRKIRRGDWIYLSYVSANRDEDVFEEPFIFRPDRMPNRHIAFGYGVHICLGNIMARTELRVFLEELLPRLSSLELDGRPTLTKSRWVQGLKTCPVRYRVT